MPPEKIPITAKIAGVACAGLLERCLPDAINAVPLGLIEYRGRLEGQFPAFPPPDELFDQPFNWLSQDRRWAGELLVSAFHPLIGHWVEMEVLNRAELRLWPVGPIADEPLLIDAGSPHSDSRPPAG